MYVVDRAAIKKKGKADKDCEYMYSSKNRPRDKQVDTR